MVYRPMVSVIIPTCNREELVIEVLKSLANQNYKDFEIIVVDQTDNPKSMFLSFVQSLPKTYNYIHDCQKGASRARNIGLKKAQGDIILFLEDDIVILDEFLIQEHVSYYKDSQIGGVGGRVIEHQKRRTKGKVGRIYPLFCIPGGTGDADEQTYIETVKGGNMSFRKSILDQMSGFDERFGHPSMYEETDVSLKVRRLGYKLIFAPKARILHLGAAGGGQRNAFDASRFRFIVYRDRILLFRNNYPQWLYPLFLISNFCLAMLPIVRFDWQAVALALKGLREGIRLYGNVQRDFC